MFELHGKYGTAKVFASVVDSEAVGQVVALLNQPYIEGSKIRMMPDIQAGAGCTVGTTMTIQDAVCPNIVGCDIGCGMEVVILKETDIDLERLDQIIRTQVPSGLNRRGNSHRYIKNTRLRELRCKNEAALPLAEISLGTLGGGNHFIEVDRDDEGRLYLVIHSGSRILGIKVSNYYQKMAYKQHQGLDPYSIETFIQNLKNAGRNKEIPAELKNLYANPPKAHIKESLAYVSGPLLDDYLHDMEIVQEYAEWNRNAIADMILKAAELHLDGRMTTIHNYIDVEHRILRKGAVSAQAGEQLIIPMNMRDGSLLCTGKGNSEWNYSAPHGAGRQVSRGKAKSMFSVDEFKRSMEGIYTTSVGPATLDECPMAYKDMSVILENIEPTVTVDKVIRPIYNFKAGNE